MDSIYYNVGNLIKIISKIELVLGTICFFIIGLSNIINELFITGLIIMLFGSLSCFITSVFLYGFGELIEKVSVIANVMIYNNNNNCQKNEYNYHYYQKKITDDKLLSIFKEHNILDIPKKSKKQGDNDDL